MASNNIMPFAVASSSKASPVSHVDKNGKPWNEAHEEHLLELAKHLTIEAIQKSHFSSFTTTQLHDILLLAQARLTTSRQDICTNHENTNANPKDDPNSDSDEVIDAAFTKRRGEKPAWQGTTTAWKSRGKPGVGWLPVDERPDMDTFLREFVTPRDGEGEQGK